MRAIYTINGVDYQSHYATIAGLCAGLKERITANKFNDLCGNASENGRHYSVEYIRIGSIINGADQERISHYIYKTPLDDRYPSKDDLRLSQADITAIEAVIKNLK